MSLAPGTVVRIVSTPPAYNWNPRMNRYLGTLMTIKGYHYTDCYMMKEDQGTPGRSTGWGWTPNMFSVIKDLVPFAGVVLRDRSAMLSDRNPEVTYIEH